MADADKEYMFVRLVIDVVEGRIELSERPAASGPKATLLDIEVNRFIPGNFVFRCKAVELCRAG
jgi:hypothetical protein